MNDQQFRQLLNYLGLSWDGYRRVRKGVKKRVGRHMQQLGCRTMGQYISAMDRSQDERLKCELHMTVSVSRFFRDRGLWRALEKEILPSIINEHVANVKVWSAGCACGEEAYSFKILWDIIEQTMGTLPELRVWATDMNPVYLKRARAAVYSHSSLKEVPGALRERYFNARRKGRKWALTDSMKKGITWQNHNLLHDDPGKRFHIVFLRNNLLTYYEEGLKRPALEKVIRAIEPAGFLVIGAHEEVPPEVIELAPLPGNSGIFQKKGSQQSKTKNIFITGPPGCGKSTLIEKLVHQIDKPVTGFFTREIRERDRRKGFSITTLDGREGILAHETIKSRWKVGKYGVNLEDINQIAVPSMIPDHANSVIVIDEVGKMECLSPLFKKTLLQVLSASKPVIGSIALKGDSFIQKIKSRDDVLLISLNEKNRDSPELFSQLLLALK